MEKKYYIFLGVVAAFFLGTGFLLTAIFYCQQCENKECSLGEIGEQEEKKDGECDFFVDVSGAVMKPRVVCMEEGDLVDDAIQGAGNVNPQAYSIKYFAQRVNLARAVEAEEKIYIPFYDDVICEFKEDPQVERAQDVVEELDLSEDSLKSKTGEVVSEDEDVVVADDEEKAEPSEDKKDCIDINNASKEELTELVGVGDARARDIIGGRSYSSIEEIKEVPGIGDATYDNIKDFICI